MRQTGLVDDHSCFPPDLCFRAAVQQVLPHSGVASSPLAIRRIRNQTRAALKGEVVPEPVEGDDKAVAQSDQKIDVRDAPEHPADESLQLQRSEFYDRGATADRREVAKMHVLERPVPLAVGDAG